jgi:hypothetical protein
VGVLVVKSQAGGGEELGSEGGGGAGVLCTGVFFGDSIVRKHKELSGHSASESIISFSLFGG